MAACQNIPQKALHSSGVTLVELVIALVIVAILASVAYPSYQNHLKRGHRAAAQAHMMDIAQRQQEYLLNARAYASSVEALNMTTPPEVASYYTIGITVNPSPPMSFTVSANPTGALARSGEVTLTLDGRGARTPTGVW